MKILQVAREYAGLAEAGGVKNVVCSLCEGLLQLGHDVQLFIPLYGCSDLNNVFNYEEIQNSKSTILVNNKEYEISFAKGILNDINIVFLVSSVFQEKMGVYTYTKEEESTNPLFVRGHGHLDGLEIEILFQKSLILYLTKYNYLPNVIHCHDATTAFIPALANTEENINFFSKVNFLVTIHNAGPAYHHEINDIYKAQKYTNLPLDILKLGQVGNAIEPYFLASFYGKLTTVSPWYAEEILDPNNENTQGLSKVFYSNNVKIYGITNGIDFEKYNPNDVEKSCLPYAYNPENLDLEGKYQCRNGFFNFFNELSLSNKKNKNELHLQGLEQFGYLDPLSENTVVFSYHGRMVHQKGLDILSKSIQLTIEKNHNVRFIITGQGNKNLEEEQIKIAHDYKGKVLYIRGYNKTLARLCVAVSDYIVLPSFFEPCGLEDFIASILGTIPLANKTGGLQKILDNKTGFLYNNNTPEELSNNCLKLIDFKNNHYEDFLTMIKNACMYVHTKYNWINVINKHYIPLYNLT